ncbi:hypothetical protein Tco_1546581 [Tanacetum coccineum]
MAESAKRHEENSNIIKEIRASTDAAIQYQGASIKTLELQIGQMSKVLQERGLGSLAGSTKTNLRDQVKSISIATSNLSEICHMETIHTTYRYHNTDTYFPKQSHSQGDYITNCCDDLKEAHEVKILDAIDHNLP